MKSAARDGFIPLTAARFKPHDFDRKSAERLLRSIQHERPVRRRMDKISRLLLGSAYLVNPLGGGVGSAEVFTVSFSGFDCVTYVETVMAMARASTTSGFLRQLRKIRYREGRIEWTWRNHYMTDWIRENQAAGFLRNITRGSMTRSRTRRLSSLAGIRPRRRKFRYFLKSSLDQIRALIDDGDLIFFVSTRPNLDTFHVGICFRAHGKVLLRHSARSQGGAVEQLLDDFLGKNSMPGFILARPV